LKKVRKNHVIQTSQQRHIINERRIMAKITSQFCVKMFSTYQDILNVYFLLEPILGGELFSLLRFSKSFPRKTATFYASNVVLAFEYLHSKNVIYRNLKPEDLLITSNGYLKLVDFGFAKVRNNSCTLCGTPQYLAPEVIQNFNHSFTVDWWSLGILIYEMIFGVVPFKGDKNMKTYAKILTEQPLIPDFRQTTFNRHKLRTKPHTRDIIERLLKKQAHKRLGAGMAGAQNVRKHPFFADMAWDQIIHQTFEPPYIPKIRDDRDLTLFEDYPDLTPEEELMDDPDGNLYDWCQEF
jgi:protein kinase A